MSSDFPVVFALYPGITQLDFTGPLEVLARLPGASVVLAASQGGDLSADGGLVFANVRAFDEVKTCALLCVPGGFLGAAGLLRGRRAACHWAFRELLPLFGAIPDEGRLVRDGNIITGGGVTAGIDMALTVVAEVAGQDVAEAVQLAIEYAPEPPFQAGRPELARTPVVAAVRGRFERLWPERLAIARRAAAALGDG